MNKAAGILVELMLNLQISSGRIDIIAILSPLIYDHGISFLSVRTSLISLSNIL